MVLCLLVGQSFAKAQGDLVVLEDDEYNFSVVTQAIMSMKPDTLKTSVDVPYRVYDGSVVNEKDTMYFRIDIWENPLEAQLDSIADEQLLDSTLVQLQDRLNGKMLYVQSMSRNGWPGRLARYDIPLIKRQAKVLLVKRKERYYVLTVVVNHHALHNKKVNRFIHSFKIYE